MPHSGMGICSLFCIAFGSLFVHEDFIFCTGDFKRPGMDGSGCRLPGQKKSLPYHHFCPDFLCRRLFCRQHPELSALHSRLSPSLPPLYCDTACDWTGEKIDLLTCRSFYKFLNFWRNKKSVVQHFIKKFGNIINKSILL